MAEFAIWAVLISVLILTEVWLIRELRKVVHYFKQTGEDMKALLKSWRKLERTLDGISGKLQDNKGFLSWMFGAKKQ